MSNVEDEPQLPKTEQSDEEDFSDLSPEPDEQAFAQEVAHVQRRKGGRKPVLLWSTLRPLDTHR